MAAGTGVGGMSEKDYNDDASNEPYGDEDIIKSEED